MRYKLLGRSGLRVSELCLGTMTFGNIQWGTPEEEAVKMYARFRDRGGNFVDTANEIYAEGRSEQIVGRLISSHRHEMVVATKYSFGMPHGGDPNSGGNQRKNLMRSLEASLKRINTDYVDLMWVHAWDGMTPAEEVMRALDDAIRQGKLLHVGISNAPAWVVAKCNVLAECRGWTPFAAMQVEYNLTERNVEHELLPMARLFGLTTLAWSPLASGILSGKYRNASPGVAAHGERKRLDVAQLKTADERNRAIAAHVEEIARTIGRSPAQVALNWLRAKPTIIPLLGARTMAQFEENIQCLDFALDAETIHRLDAISQPAPVYPHDYLARVRGPLHAGFQEAIDVENIL